jgi:polysaccharide export outer membrane protein
MKKFARGTCLAVALLPLGVIGGCALAPGGHIDYEAQEVSLDEQIDIVTITPDLISAYRTDNGTSKAQGVTPEFASELENYEYRVGPGDVLNIIVYEHPELTIPAGGERSAEESGNIIHADGTIYYPYIGSLKVEGRTVGEIRQMITSRLATFVTEPQVEVRVAGFHSKKVYVSGEVNAPGAQPITNVPLTILDAISAAGGATENANWHNITLTRNGQERALSLYQMLKRGDLAQNSLLQPGDVLHIASAENQNISVMGQVRNPGNITTGRERMSLTDALGRAGGVVESRAEPSGIFVIRGNPAGSEKMATVYQLDISNAVALNMGSYFPLEPHDVVYVTSAPLARWNNVISLLLPSISLPGNVASTSNEIGDL